jgi:chorismate-pyruvate lyase
MPTPEFAALERCRFHDVGSDPAAAALLRLLLAQDGSATRLCETIAGGAIALHLLEQRVVSVLPVDAHALLPGREYLERITSIAAHGEVMMDNLSYIALERLPPALRGELEGGRVPIGHLLGGLWMRRRFVAPGAAFFERLWAVVGQPDPAASRAYCVDTPEGACMLIGETFRRGMRM